MTWGLATGGTTIEQQTFATMVASSPSEGTQVYVTDSTVKDIFVFNGTIWKAFGYHIYNNDEGAAIDAGEPVVISAVTDNSVTLTATNGDPMSAGICVVGGADSTDILVKNHGTATANKRTTAVATSGDYIICENVKGQVDFVSSVFSAAGAFGIATETTLSTDPTVEIIMMGKELL